MRTVFEDEETDAILLIDAANAFNSINRQPWTLYLAILTFLKMGKR